jgi:hypothetical protein
MLRTELFRTDYRKALGVMQGRISTAGTTPVAAPFCLNPLVLAGTARMARAASLAMFAAVDGGGCWGSVVAMLVKKRLYRFMDKR